ncbi:MAG: electron transfer flavoprotein subunit alpha/FixB family protein [Deltaproteobacteria bacterium]|nr:electron transfer flavoprotein subunit alpha/FixB family protein [Deltaproteobacteria bacterium]MDQ3295920.1 electron transfer flavoprotein subunit alpha/FixB family protein [Myxococcota bacterium]
MGNVLAFCEFSDDGLRTSALANLTFARQAAQAHGGEVIALVMGGGVQGAAAAAAKYAPKVLVVDEPTLAHYLAETYAPIVARLAKEHGATVVCATATSVGKDLMPRVASLLDAGQASDISKLEGKDTFVRPILSGNANSTVQISTPIICVTPRQTEFEPAPELGAAGAVTAAPAGTIDALGATFDRLDAQKSDRPDLGDAKVVVSGGRGMKNGENFKVLEELADLLGAAMGASRAATDAGMVPADWQVGQTGKIVAPKLYFAVAISGAIQHLAGMKGSKTIVAINKNKDEPIFQVADYGIVADWEKAVPELIAEIKKLKASR